MASTIKYFPSFPIVNVPFRLLNPDGSLLESKHDIESCTWFLDDKPIDYNKNDHLDENSNSNNNNNNNKNSPIDKISNFFKTKINSSTSPKQPSNPTFYIPSDKDKGKVLKVICKLKHHHLHHSSKSTTTTTTTKQDKNNDDDDDVDNSNIPKPPPPPPPPQPKSSNETIRDFHTFEFSHVIRKYADREWIDIDSSSTTTTTNKNILRVIQYNILADCYNQPHIFPHCNPKCLPWSYRRYILPKQIIEQNADIIGLQEVDYRFSELFNELKDKGFSVVDQVLIDYENLLNANYLSHSQYKYISSDPTILKIIESKLIHFDHHTRHCLLLLKDNHSNRTFIVSSVHLYWGPQEFKFNYQYQCIQTIILTNIIENVLLKHKLNPKETPVIILGDFNSGPDGGSYRYLDNGKFERNDPTLTLEGSCQIKLEKIEHPFSLKSVYSYHPEGEPKFTTVTGHFQGNIDQIWKSNQFSVKRILDIGKLSNYIEFRALPSMILPSDHIMLSADLEFK
eukprot:gene4299-5379_t